MIKTLHIKNYLLIPEVQVEFERGLTVITGETGAGKSLIVDSLKLAFGAKTDPGIVRDGCEKAEITVTFEINNAQTMEFLESNNLYAGTNCVIRREIYKTKPTRAYVNDNAASLQILRDLGTTLVDIHGQHEHHTLLKATTQRRILDGHAGNTEDVRRLTQNSRLIHRAEVDRKDAEQRKTDYERHLEYLRDQIELFDQVQPEKSEFSALKENLLRLSHSEELSTALGEISMGLFYSDELTVSGTLSEFSRKLRRISEFDSSIESQIELLEEAKFRVDDVARELRLLADRIEHNPAEIAAIEERMNALQRLARIHSFDADNLPEALESLQAKIETYEKELEKIAKFDSNIEAFKTEYRKTASAISNKRRSVATEFGEIITNQMQHLGMEGGCFSVELPESNPEHFESYGYENTVFMVSTNPGQSSGALSQVASGGELSRLSLALQVTSLDAAKVPTIVFDEVDVGIGGRVAERIGKLLQTLGQSVQIICITHLPQVAAQGHQQLNVSKITDDTSIIEVSMLDQNQRVNEIARMLGGAKITHRTIEHAREMLSQGMN